MAAIRDTFKYRLLQREVSVDHGITYDLNRREAESQLTYPGSVIQQIGCRTTRTAAVKWIRNLSRSSE